MNTILFVCQANVGRSQMAEAFFRFHSGTNTVRSAGVEDFREKYHHRPTPEIIQTMREKGIDISGQRIDFLSAEMVDQADVVVVLCARELCPEFLLHSNKAIFREIEDPHRRDEHTIRRIRDQIEEVVLEVMSTY